MTTEQLLYIAKQILIIEGKTNEDQLIRYETLLGGAVLPKDTYEVLRKACDKRRRLLNRGSAMAENGDTDDLLQ